MLLANSLFNNNRYPIPSAPIAFLGMTGIYNLYVWTMAFIYAPLTSQNEDNDEYEVSVDAGVGSNAVATREIGDMQL